MCCHLLSSSFSISFGMCCHLLCSSLGCIKNLQIVNTVLIKSKNLVIEGLDFIKRCRLGKTFSSCFFRTCQPRVELLDSCPVLSPVLDIIGVFVAFNLCLFSKFSCVLCYSVKFILEGLSISWNLVALRKKFLLPALYSA